MQPDTSPAPKRIRLRRVKGWTKPEGAVVVGRPSCWGNPFAYRTPMALARVPALDGSAWEYEGRISTDGFVHPYQHADGSWTRHTVRYMTLAECVELYERCLLNPTRELRLYRQVYRTVHGKRLWLETETLTAEIARRELGGRDLACWCDLDKPCHVDVLLRVSNDVSNDVSIGALTGGGR